VELVTRKFLL